MCSLQKKDTGVFNIATSAAVGSWTSLEKFSLEYTYVGIQSMLFAANRDPKPSFFLLFIYLGRGFAVRVTLSEVPFFFQSCSKNSVPAFLSFSDLLCKLDFTVILGNYICGEAPFQRLYFPELYSV